MKQKVVMVPNIIYMIATLRYDIHLSFCEFMCMYVVQSNFGLFVWVHVCVATVHTLYVYNR